VTLEARQEVRDWLQEHDPKGSSTAEAQGLKHSVGELDNLHLILREAETQGWGVLNISRDEREVSTTKDILAALEHKLGDDGRARAWQCPHCEQHDHLTTIGC
jgi:hypothetical protein